MKKHLKLLTVLMGTTVITLPTPARTTIDTNIDLHRLAPRTLNKMFDDAVDKRDGKTFQKFLSVNHDLRHKAKHLKDEVKLDLLTQIANLSGGEMAIINDDNLLDFAQSIDPDSINTINKAPNLFKMRRVISGGSSQKLIQVLKRVRGLLSKEISLRNWNRTSYLSKSGSEYVLLQTLSELAKLYYRRADYVTAQQYFEELPSNFIPEDEELSLIWADMNLRGLGNLSPNRTLAIEILKDYYRSSTNEEKPRLLLDQYPNLSVLVF